MNPIGIAVAGAGLIGRRHIELIRESVSCELAAIVDPAPAAAVLARDCGVPHYRTLAELFAARRPDAVIAATPNSLHAHNGV
ncbi:MAG TPA: Gfo/Idh/MocA family oxidoreductase, partial [Casimicrobiaceae bacterium]|nr:Gfo/Idh/MocA family oxidoreductase [Casimicrobiaceae bacterium]